MFLTLVVLAAGRGARFGGPKQLAVVRDDGATVTDILVERAAAAGIERVAVVANPDVAAAFDRYHVAVQAQPRGTADAVLCAQPLVPDAFIVVNGDDIYPRAAFATLASHLRLGDAREHATVGFRLDRTLVGSQPESRALLTVDPDGRLVAIREGKVQKHEALQFVSNGTTEPVEPSAIVSMNIWAFRRSVFTALAAAVTASSRPEEVYLPDVVSEMVGAGEIVRVVPSADRCIGLTYAADLATVRAELA